MLIDSHSHLNFNAYKKDADEVIRRSLNNDIWVINVGSQYDTSKRAVEIAEKYKKGVYAAVGLHPVHLETGLVRIKSDPEEIRFSAQEEVFDCEKYKELAKSEKVVAVGEVGFDYYWRPKTKTKMGLFKEKQKKVLIQQINLAKKLNLPLIFHCRMAHQDLIETLKSCDSIKGVVHCYTGNSKDTQAYLNMGLHFGFNGLIFKMNVDDIIKKIPLDKILIETDCPYLTPPQETGRNEPLYVKYVVQKIAEIKNVNFEKIAEITTQNAKNLFKI